MFLCTEKGEKKPHDSKPGICNVEIHEFDSEKNI